MSKNKIPAKNTASNPPLTEKKEDENTPLIKPRKKSSAKKPASKADKNKGKKPAQPKNKGRKKSKTKQSQPTTTTARTTHTTTAKQQPIRTTANTASMCFGEFTLLIQSPELSAQYEYATQDRATLEETINQIFQQKEERLTEHARIQKKLPSKAKRYTAAVACVGIIPIIPYLELRKRYHENQAKLKESYAHTRELQRREQALTQVVLGNIITKPISQEEIQSAEDEEERQYHLAEFVRTHGNPEVTIIPAGYRNILRNEIAAQRDQWKMERPRKFLTLHPIRNRKQRKKLNEQDQTLAKLDECCDDTIETTATDAQIDPIEVQDHYGEYCKRRLETDLTALSSSGNGPGALTLNVINDLLARENDKKSLLSRFVRDKRESTNQDEREEQLDKILANSAGKFQLHKKYGLRNPFKQPKTHSKYQQMLEDLATSLTAIDSNQQLSIPLIYNDKDSIVTEILEKVAPRPGQPNFAQIQSPFQNYINKLLESTFCDDFIQRYNTFRMSTDHPVLNIQATSITTAIKDTVESELRSTIPEIRALNSNFINEELEGTEDAKYKELLGFIALYLNPTPRPTQDVLQLYNNSLYGPNGRIVDQLKDMSSENTSAENVAEFIHTIDNAVALLPKDKSETKNTQRPKAISILRSLADGTYFDSEQSSQKKQEDKTTLTTYLPDLQLRTADYDQYFESLFLACHIRKIQQNPKLLATEKQDKIIKARNDATVKPIKASFDHTSHMDLFGLLFTDYRVDEHGEEILIGKKSGDEYTITTKANQEPEVVKAGHIDIPLTIAKIEDSLIQLATAEYKRNITHFIDLYLDEYDGRNDTYAQLMCSVAPEEQLIRWGIKRLQFILEKQNSDSENSHDANYRHEDYLTENDKAFLQHMRLRSSMAFWNKLDALIAQHINHPTHQWNSRTANFVATYADFNDRRISRFRQIIAHYNHFIDIPIKVLCDYMGEYHYCGDSYLQSLVDLTLEHDGMMSIPAQKIRELIRKHHPHKDGDNGEKEQLQTCPQDLDQKNKDQLQEFIDDATKQLTATITIPGCKHQTNLQKKLQKLARTCNPNNNDNIQQQLSNIPLEALIRFATEDVINNGHAELQNLFGLHKDLLSLSEVPTNNTKTTVTQIPLNKLHDFASQNIKNPSKRLQATLAKKSADTGYKDIGENIIQELQDRILACVTAEIHRQQNYHAPEPELADLVVTHEGFCNIPVQKLEAQVSAQPLTDELLSNTAAKIIDRGGYDAIESEELHNLIAEYTTADPNNLALQILRDHQDIMDIPLGLAQEYVTITSAAQNSLPAKHTHYLQQHRGAFEVSNMALEHFTTTHYSAETIKDFMEQVNGDELWNNIASEDIHRLLVEQTPTSEHTNDQLYFWLMRQIILHGGLHKIPNEVVASPAIRELLQQNNNPSFINELIQLAIASTGFANIPLRSMSELEAKYPDSTDPKISALIAQYGNLQDVPEQQLRDFALSKAGQEFVNLVNSYQYCRAMTIEQISHQLKINSKNFSKFEISLLQLFISKNGSKNVPTDDLAKEFNKTYKLNPYQQALLQSLHNTQENFEDLSPIIILSLIIPFFAKDNNTAHLRSLVGAYSNHSAIIKIAQKDLLETAIDARWQRLLDMRHLETTYLGIYNTPEHAAKQYLDKHQFAPTQIQTDILYCIDQYRSLQNTPTEVLEQFVCNHTSNNETVLAEIQATNPTYYKTALLTCISELLSAAIPNLSNAQPNFTNRQIYNVKRIREHLERNIDIRKLEIAHNGIHNITHDMAKDYLDKHQFAPTAMQTDILSYIQQYDSLQNTPIDILENFAKTYLTKQKTITRLLALELLPEDQATYNIKLLSCITKYLSATTPTITDVSLNHPAGDLRATEPSEEKAEKKYSADLGTKDLLNELAATTPLGSDIFNAFGRTELNRAFATHLQEDFTGPYKQEKWCYTTEFMFEAGNNILGQFETMASARNLQQLYGNKIRHLLSARFSPTQGEGSILLRTAEEYVGEIHRQHDPRTHFYASADTLPRIYRQGQNRFDKTLYRFIDQLKRDNVRQSGSLVFQNTEYLASKLASDDALDSWRVFNMEQMLANKYRGSLAASANVATMQNNTLAAIKQNLATQKDTIEGKNRVAKLCHVLQMKYFEHLSNSNNKIDEAQKVRDYNTYKNTTEWLLSRPSKNIASINESGRKLWVTRAGKIQAREACEQYIYETKPHENKYYQELERIRAEFIFVYYTPDKTLLEKIRLHHIAELLEDAEPDPSKVDLYIRLVTKYFGPQPALTEGKQVLCHSAEGKLKLRGLFLAHINNKQYKWNPTVERLIKTWGDTETLMECQTKRFLELLAENNATATKAYLKDCKFTENLTHKDTSPEQIQMMYRLHSELEKHLNMNELKKYINDLAKTNLTDESSSTPQAFPINWSPNQELLFTALANDNNLWHIRLLHTLELMQLADTDQTSYNNMSAIVAYISKVHTSKRPAQNAKTGRQEIWPEANRLACEPLLDTLFSGYDSKTIPHQFGRELLIKTFGKKDRHASYIAHHLAILLEAIPNQPNDELNHLYKRAEDYLNHLGNEGFDCENGYQIEAPTDKQEPTTQQSVKTLLTETFTALLTKLEKNKNKPNSPYKWRKRYEKITSAAGDSITLQKLRIRRIDELLQLRSFNASKDYILFVTNSSNFVEYAPQDSIMHDAECKQRLENIFKQNLNNNGWDPNAFLLVSAWGSDELRDTYLIRLIQELLEEGNAYETERMLFFLSTKNIKKNNFMRDHNGWQKIYRLLTEYVEDSQRPWDLNIDLIIKECCFNQKDCDTKKLAQRYNRKRFCEILTKTGQPYNYIKKCYPHESLHNLFQNDEENHYQCTNGRDFLTTQEIKKLFGDQKNNLLEIAASITAYVMPLHKALTDENEQYPEIDLAVFDLVDKVLCDAFRQEIENIEQETEPKTQDMRQTLDAWTSIKDKYRVLYQHRVRLDKFKKDLMHGEYDEANRTKDGFDKVIRRNKHLLKPLEEDTGKRWEEEQRQNINFLNSMQTCVIESMREHTAIHYVYKQNITPILEEKRESDDLTEIKHFAQRVDYELTAQILKDHSSIELCSDAQSITRQIYLDEAKEKYKSEKSNEQDQFGRTQTIRRTPEQPFKNMPEITGYISRGGHREDFSNVLRLHKEFRANKSHFVDPLKVYIDTFDQENPDLEQARLAAQRFLSAHLLLLQETSLTRHFNGLGELSTNNPNIQALHTCIHKKKNPAKEILEKLTSANGSCSDLDKEVFLSIQKLQQSERTKSSINAAIERYKNGNPASNSSSKNQFSEKALKTTCTTIFYIIAAQMRNDKSKYDAEKIAKYSKEEIQNHVYEETVQAEMHRVEPLITNLQHNAAADIDAIINSAQELTNKVLINFRNKEQVIDEAGNADENFSTIRKQIDDSIENNNPQLIEQVAKNAAKIDYPKTQFLLMYLGHVIAETKEDSEEQNALRSQQRKIIINMIRRVNTTYDDFKQQLQDIINGESSTFSPDPDSHILLYYGLDRNRKQELLQLLNKAYDMALIHAVYQRMVAEFRDEQTNNYSFLPDQYNLMLRCVDAGSAEILRNQALTAFKEDIWEIIYEGIRTELTNISNGQQNEHIFTSKQYALVLKTLPEKTEDLAELFSAAREKLDSDIMVEDISTLRESEQEQLLIDMLQLSCTLCEIESPAVDLILAISKQEKQEDIKHDARYELLSSLYQTASDSGTEDSSDTALCCADVIINAEQDIQELRNILDLTGEIIHTYGIEHPEIYQLQSHHQNATNKTMQVNTFSEWIDDSATIESLKKAIITTAEKYLENIPQCATTKTTTPQTQQNKDEDISSLLQAGNITQIKIKANSLCRLLNKHINTTYELQETINKETSFTETEKIKLRHKLEQIEDLVLIELNPTIYETIYTDAAAELSPEELNSFAAYQQYLLLLNKTCSHFSNNRPAEITAEDMLFITNADEANEFINTIIEELQTTFIPLIMQGKEEKFPSARYLVAVAGTVEQQNSFDFQLRNYCLGKINSVNNKLAAPTKTKKILSADEVMQARSALPYLESSSIPAERERAKAFKESIAEIIKDMISESEKTSNNKRPTPLQNNYRLFIAFNNDKILEGKAVKILLSSLAALCDKSTRKRVNIPQASQEELLSLFAHFKQKESKSRKQAEQIERALLALEYYKPPKTEEEQAEDESPVVTSSDSMSTDTESVYSDRSYSEPATPRSERTPGRTRTSTVASSDTNGILAQLRQQRSDFGRGRTSSSLSDDDNDSDINNNDAFKGSPRTYTATMFSYAPIGKKPSTTIQPPRRRITRDESAVFAPATPPKSLPVSASAPSLLTVKHPTNTPRSSIDVPYTPPPFELGGRTPPISTAPLEKYSEEYQLGNEEKIYSGRMAGKHYTLTEAKSASNGSCGYYTLGIDRQEIGTTLLQEIAINEEICQKIALDIASDLFNHEYETSQLSHLYNEVNEKTRENMDDLMQKCAEYSMVQKYLSHSINDINSWIGVNTILAYAQTANIAVYIWRPTGGTIENEVSCDSDYKYEPENPDNTIHMLFTEGFTHFNLLYQKPDAPELEEHYPSNTDPENDAPIIEDEDTNPFLSGSFQQSHQN